MDIPYREWLDIEYLREVMNQHQQTCPGSEIVDSSSSPSFEGYPNLVTSEQSINAVTICKDLEKQESYKATTTSYFAPIGGSTSSGFTISFGDITSTPINQNQVNGGYTLEYYDAIRNNKELNLNELLGSIELPKRVSGTRRNKRQAQEHILAERKRREKLTQRFFSLAGLLPEIKKMDKATVLEDASKYIKHLQNRVAELERTSIVAKNINQESTTSMSKSKSHGRHEEVSSFDEMNSLAFSHGIKVRTLGSNVLVRIYCKINASLPLEALNEMERLHLTIVCNSVLPISSTDAVITVMAKMSEELTVTAKDIVKCLRLSLSNLC